MLCALFDHVARPLLIAATLLVGGVVLADPAPVALAPDTAGELQLDPTGSSADRVAAASRVRVVAQSFHGAACLVHAEIMPDAGREALISARREMAHLLDALEHGNPRMGFDGAETRRKTVRKLHDVRAMWEGMRRSVNGLIQDSADSAALAEMALFEGILNETAFQLQTEVSGQYSHPFELLQSDALAIELAARQALWAEQITHSACTTWRTNGDSAALTEAMARLSFGLAALEEGQPALGLAPAPTPQIGAELAALRADWARIELDVARAVSGSATQEELRATFASLSTLSAQLQAVAAGYADVARSRT